MKHKYIRFSITFFIASYIILCLVLFSLSYKFFLDDFILIEKEQNKNNITTFLNAIDKNMEALKNTTNDYSKWDDTYEFIQDENEDYIYENFRTGSQTLKEINLDSIIYVNLENKVIYSKYDSDFLEKSKEKFEKIIIEKFKNSENINTITTFDSKFIYLFKSQIKKSDKTGENKGYILTAKIINSEFLSSKYSIFKSIEISNNLSNTFDMEIKLDFINSRITTSLEYNELKNNVQFFDKNGDYVISLITKSNRDLINNSKRTIIIFNVILFFILFFIFFFIYKNQSLIHYQNEILNKRVKERTKKLNIAYKKLNEKNIELEELVNIDFLTKVRNRRSYFIESKKFLEKASLNDENLTIAIIDMDDFKKINDTYGHGVGDLVLISFCEIVNSFIDENILFGRIGGEEFCLTFYNKEFDEVNAICEAIRNKTLQTVINVNGDKIKFTISMGISSKIGSDDIIDKILQRADLLLYEAKKSGKNRVIREVK